MMRRFFLMLALAAALSVACGTRQARAQFIGYTSPQTVTQSGTINCGGNAVIANLGQSVHSIRWTTSLGTAKLGQIYVEGSNDGLTFDQLSSAGSVLTGQEFAAGYRTVIRVRLLCDNGTSSGAGAGTTAFQYSGVSSSPYVAFGASLDTLIYQPMAIGAPANANKNATVSTPYGSTAGIIGFSYTGGPGPAGSTITVSISDPSISPAGTTISTLTPSTAAGAQFFIIPHFPITSDLTNQASQAGLSVGYNSGGASAVTFSMAYFFSPPGYPPPQGLAGLTGTGATQVQGAAASGSPPAGNPLLVAAGTDGTNVQTARVANVFKPFNVAVCATETTIWTPAAGKKFRLMGMTVYGAANASLITFRDNTAGTTIFIAGTNNAPTPVPLLGNGILSAAANNPLTIQLGAPGTCTGTVWGTEE